MEQDFYKGRLSQKYGLNVHIPNPQEREIVHRIIYDELVVGKVRGRSKEQYLNIIQAMVNQGVEAVILGCTEIMLLIQEQDAQIPLFDTTKIHAGAAVEYALTQ